MRMMMKIAIPCDAGNKAIRDGVLAKVMGDFKQQWHPEAMYFVTEHGKRTAVTVVDMKDPSQLVQMAEPLFMGLNAEISCTPCMNHEDLGRGMQAFSGK